MATHNDTNPNLNNTSLIFSQKSKKNNTFLNLPKDIIYYIFFKLSVKTLLRLRSVCKSWLSIISSRDFIKTHLYISTNDPHFTCHRLFLTDWDKIDFSIICSVICSVNSLLNEPYTKSQLNNATEKSFIDKVLDEPVARTPNDDNIYGVVGYCNGLFCLESFYRHLFFWNPSTRKSRRLPRLYTIDQYGFCYDKSSDNLVYTIDKYGFCYDESNDDFKLFAIRRTCPSECQSYQVSVYSFKSDFWRPIADFPFGIVGSEGEFANGAVHWIATSCTKKRIIVSLDIVTEECEEILLPKYGEGVGVDSWTMNTFGGNLSVLFKIKDVCIDFWVMKERGVKEPWTKLFSIPYNMDGLVTNSRNIKPICTSMNGDILISLDRTIILYSSKDNTVLKCLPDGCYEELRVFTYVESLVSPYL